MSEMGFNSSVKVIPFPEIENAYLIISCYHYKNDEPDRLRSIMSFFYDGKTCGTEWEPENGPIQLWYPVDETYEEKRVHYFYPFVKVGGWSWYQMAVEGEELKPAMFRGDYKWIFSVLQRWAESHARD